MRLHSNPYQGRVALTATIEQPVKQVHGTKPDWLWPGYHCTLDKELRRNYGISCKQYNELLAKQHGVCAICKRPQGRYRLAVDHNPKTGKIRGLIHMRHNRHITPEVAEYILAPPAEEFDLVVPRDRQRYLNNKRAKQRKSGSERTRAKMARADRVEDEYEQAVKKLLEEHEE